MTLAPHTSKSVTASGWQHAITHDPRRGLVCQAWNPLTHDTVEVTGSSDFDLRHAALDAIDLVDAERREGRCLA